MIMNKITALLSILFISSLFCSCEHPGMEYIIQEKGLNVQESTIYVDGFLAKGTPLLLVMKTNRVTAWVFRSSTGLVGNYSSSLSIGHPKQD